MEKQVTEIVDEFRRELDKTAVISDEFKQWLLSKVLDIVRVSHKKGYSIGVKDTQKSRKKE